MRISQTVYDILRELGEIAEIEPAEVLEDAADLSNRIEPRMKARAAGYEP